MRSNACSNCCGAQYVFLPWFDRMLKEQGIRMMDIPADILKIIPMQYFVYCHCNPRVVLLNRRFTSCADCNGTTWKFSEFAEHKGYFQKKVNRVYWQKIMQLPAHYFERYFCGQESISREKNENGGENGGVTNSAGLISTSGTLAKSRK